MQELILAFLFLSEIKTCSVFFLYKEGENVPEITNSSHILTSHSLLRLVIQPEKLKLQKKCSLMVLIGFRLLLLSSNSSFAAQLGSPEQNFS